MQPVRPWTRITNVPIPGRVCGMQPVRDNAQRKWLVVGSNTGVWLVRSGDPVDITPTGFAAGYETTELGGGFGAGDYDREMYGTPRTQETGITLEADTWHFDVWGEFIVGCSVGDGTAYVWRPGTLSTPYDATMLPISNAPANNRGLLTTNERHLMLISAGGDPRKVQWSAREDYTVWAPTALNLAGDLTLETAGSLQTGLKAPNGIVVLSEVDAFLIRYVGQPFGYGQDRIGHNCGIIGPHAGASTSDFVVWMGITGFWSYRGQLQSIPCDVWDFVFRDLNLRQTSQISCGHNADFHELWWFFPKGDATKNSHYVSWNYRENWWATGELARTHWQEKGAWTASVAAGADGFLYEHEKPFTSPGAAMRPAPYITSAPFMLGSGENIMHVTHITPDQECKSLDALSYTFATRFTPACGDKEFGPYYPDADGYTDTRFAGREIEWTVRAEKDISWRMGILHAEIAPGGRR